MTKPALRTNCGTTKGTGSSSARRYGPSFCWSTKLVVAPDTLSRYVARRRPRFAACHTLDSPYLTPGHFPVPRFAKDQLIKKGGEWKGLTADDTNVTFTFDIVDLDAPTNTLRWEVGNSKAAAGFVLSDIKLGLWQSYDEGADGRRIGFNMNRATQFSGSAGRMSPSFPTSQGNPLTTAVATCDHCPLWNDAGLEGGALAFSGSNQVMELPGASQLGLASSSWTVSIWLKPRWVAAANGRFSDLPVLSTQDADGTGIRLFLNGNTRSAAMIIGSTPILSPFAVPDNEWTHIAWTFNEVRSSCWLVWGVASVLTRSRGGGQLGLSSLAPDLTDPTSGPHTPHPRPCVLILRPRLPSRTQGEPPSLSTPRRRF